MVSCNAYLFNDTVRANFRMADPEITDKQIYAYLRQVDMEDFIRAAGCSRVCVSSSTMAIFTLGFPPVLLTGHPQDAVVGNR